MRLRKHRSAKSGQYVSHEEAAANPDTTVGEVDHHPAAFEQVVLAGIEVVDNYGDPRKIENLRIALIPFRK